MYGCGCATCSQRELRWLYSAVRNRWQQRMRLEVTLSSTSWLQKSLKWQGSGVRSIRPPTRYHGTTKLPPLQKAFSRTLFPNCPTPRHFAPPFSPLCSLLAYCLSRVPLISRKMMSPSYIINLAPTESFSDRECRVQEHARAVIKVNAAERGRRQRQPG